MGVGGSGLEWMRVAGSGWKWMRVGGSGWKWIGVDGSGWEHGLVQLFSKHGESAKRTNLVLKALEIDSTLKHEI